MKRADVLRRLEERLARGEISEKTYLEIKGRYEAEPEEPEAPAGAPGQGVEGDIRAAVGDIERLVRESVEPALRGIDFSDLGRGVQTSQDTVRIVGGGVVAGPVRTHEFKSAGSGRVTGDLEVQEAKVAGSCAFDGNVTAQEFSSAGSSKVRGRLTASEVHSNGSLSVDGDLLGREVHVRGALTVGGQVRGDEFHLAGGARIGGPLEAKEVSIELGGEVAVQAIRGDEIRVTRPRGFFVGRNNLYADRIEGQEVYLECTIANVVVGDEVRIGPHCRIGVVEARDLMVHESAEVKERRAPGSGRPPPPPAPAAAPSPHRPSVPPSP